MRKRRTARSSATPSACDLRGRVYTDNHDYGRAIADFTKKIEIEPDNADAYRGRSVAYVKKQNPTAGLADYNRGIEAAKRKIQSSDRLLQ